MSGNIRGKKLNSKEQGEKFEKDFCEFLSPFLKECFEFKKFKISPKRQAEGGGYEYGRDVDCAWYYKKEVRFDWWFECKSHKKASSIEFKKELADKVIDVIIAPEPPSCYCVVASNRELDDWAIDKLKRINESLITKTYFFCWTPKILQLKDCIALCASKKLPSIWSAIYEDEKMPDIDDQEYYEILNMIRSEFEKNNENGMEKQKRIQEMIRIQGQLETLPDKNKIKEIIYG